MPPRKRKTNAPNHMRPLKFVNSPIFQPAPVLTPVLAVDNPIRAKTVPIEELTATSWVSPQFRNGASPRRRCQSTQYQQKSRQLRHEIDGLPSNNGRQLQKCRFKPLQFTTNPGPAGSESSDLTCVQTNENDSDKNGIEYHVGKSDRPTGGRPPSVTINENLCDGIHSSAVADVHKTLDQSLNPCLVNLHCENGVQPTKFCISDKSGERGNPQRVNKTLRGSGHLHPHGRNSFTVNRTGLDVTDTIDMPCNSRSCSNQDFCDLNNVDNRASVSALKDLPRRSSSDSTFHTGYQSPEINLFWEHSTAGTPPRSETPAVLAVDTPECDYGLTLRQRQLKYRHSQRKDYGCDS